MHYCAGLFGIFVFYFVGVFSTLEDVLVLKSFREVLGLSYIFGLLYLGSSVTFSELYGISRFNFSGAFMIFFWSSRIRDLSELLVINFSEYFRSFQKIFMSYFSGYW